jgi:hypothetical protein
MSHHHDLSHQVRPVATGPPPGGATQPGLPGSERRSRQDLLEAFDSQLRGPSAHLCSPGARVEVEGEVVRALMAGGGGMVTATGLARLSRPETRSLVRSQVEVFSRLGEPFEWKTWSHDHPKSFCQTLLDFGFTTAETETVLVGLTLQVAGHEVALPAQARLRRLRPGLDFKLLEEQLSLAFQSNHRDHALACEAAVGALPEQVSVHAVEVEGRLVATGRLELVEGTQFGTLWGGSVVPGWRHRGLYRALVVARARLAKERGFGLLQVDALATSRPILERLGLIAVCTTTGYLWSPETSAPPAQS